MPTSTSISPSSYIYVGGKAVNSQGEYYKLDLNNPSNVKLNPLPNSNPISSIVSYDSAVYMTANVNGYWKNDTFISVKNSWNIQYIAFANNNIYLSGLAQDGLAYWINNNENSLVNTYNRTTYPNEAFITYGLSGMAVQGNNVFLSGQYNFSDEPTTTKDTSTQPGLYESLWANGNNQILFHDYWNVNIAFQGTSGIATLGNDIYVASRISADSASKYYGGYWKNGVWNNISSNFMPNSIYSSGADIYIVGYNYTVGSYITHASYWKNDSLYSIPNGQIATAVVANGQDIYILGIDNNNNNVIWKNGDLFATLGQANNMATTCIAIAPK